MIGLNVEFHNIPDQLQQRRQWVLWKLERGNGKSTKIMYTINGKKASSTDLTTWAGFQEVVNVFQQSSIYSGIGYVFSSADPFTGIDLDSDENKTGFTCMHDGGLLGQLTDEAKTIVQQLNSYTEYSQSGAGLHIIVEAAKLGQQCRTGNFEIYDRDRFFVMTGKRVEGTPPTIEKRQQEANELYTRFFGAQAQKEKASEPAMPQSPKLDDSTILSIARSAKNGAKFSALYDAGTVEQYGGDDSAADQALCDILAFYTQDVEQIDRLFRQSALMRDKWEREDYRERTIHKAISDLKAWYTNTLPDLDEDKKTQAQLIMELTNDMEFFHSPDDEAYVRLFINGHYENWMVRSSNFRSLLAKLFYDRHKKPPGSAALKDAMSVLEGKAVHEGDERPIFIRVAEADGAIYLDLCNESWQVVRITAQGWNVIDHSPVIFKRSKTMAALPIPQPGGNIEQLRPFVNVKDIQDFMLVVAWLLSCLRDKYPFPILTIQGEQGSSKSTTTKVIRTLVDPATQPLLSFQDNERDIAIKANNTWVLAYDNLSGLSAKISDVLCKLSTGGGFSTRKLHTDDEEMIFNAMRPMILNGIDDIAKRPDLLDRALVLNLPAIDHDDRRTEKEFWEAFYLEQPYILGALCEATAGAMAQQGHVELTELPRMVDFAEWSAAAWEGNHWDFIYGDFMGMYQGNRQLAIEQGIDSDPFAEAIIRFMEDKSEWAGTPTETLNQLSPLVDYSITYSRAWPAPNKLRDRVRRIAPALRMKGIEFIEMPRTKTDRKIAFIKKSEA